MRVLGFALVVAVALAACGNDDRQESGWDEQLLNEDRPALCAAYQVDVTSPACECVANALVRNFATPAVFFRASDSLTPETRAYNAEVLECGGVTQLDAVITHTFEFPSMTSDSPTSTG